MRKNVASQVIGAQLVRIIDGSAFDDEVLIYITGDGGTQALGTVNSGVCVNEGRGYYSYVLAQAETNYNLVACSFVGAGAYPATVQVYTDIEESGATVTAGVDWDGAFGWNFGQLQQKVLGWLDDTEDTGRMLAMAKQSLNDSNIARSSEYPWRFMRTTSTLTLSLVSHVYTLPLNLYRLLYLKNTRTNQLLVEVPVLSLQELSGTPVAMPNDTWTPFYFTGTREITTMVDATMADPIEVGYLKNPTEMTLAGDFPDLPWPHSQLILWDAMLDLKSYAQDSVSLIPYWLKKRDDALYRLYEAYKSDQTLGSYGQYIHQVGV